MTKDGSAEGIKTFDDWLFKQPGDAPVEAVAALPEWQPEAQAHDFMATYAMAGGRRGTAQQPVSPPIDSGQAVEEF